jgi:hypothetical protein
VTDESQIQEWKCAVWLESRLGGSQLPFGNWQGFEQLCAAGHG